jgi:hypothetical protein
MEIILVKEKETPGTWRFKENKEDHPIIYLTKATIPNLKYTTKEKNNRTIATRIADAITKDESVIASVDAFPSISKYSKKRPNTNLPGFIKKAVHVRNFF